MRRCWLAAALALASCSHSFDNPLEPGAHFALALATAEQAGVHAVRLAAAPLSDPAVTAFAYFRADGSGAAVALGERTVADPVLVDVQAVAGTTYHYSVRAKSASGALSAPSPVRDVTVQPTPAVTLEATPVDIGQVELKVGKASAWASQIVLARSSDTGTTGSTSRTLAAEGGTERDDVDEGATYTYVATPTDAFGGAGEAATAVVKVAWQRPQGLTVERRLAIPDHVTLAWEAVEKATGFVIENAGSAGIWEEVARTSEFRLEVENLSARADYWWRVRALGANGKTTTPSDEVETPVPDWGLELAGGAGDPLPSAATPRAAKVATVAGTPWAYVVYAEDSRVSAYRRNLETIGPWQLVYQADFDASLPLTLTGDGPTLVFPLGRHYVAPTYGLSRVELTPGAVERIVGFGPPGATPVRRQTDPVVLSDGGTLFAFGGFDSTAHALGTALSITFDDTPALWHTISYENGPSPRSGSAAVRLANVEVYAFGGYVEALGDVDGRLFHVDAAHGSTWTEETAQGPEARQGAGTTAFAAENGFFLLGGRAGDGHPLPNEALWSFDAAARSWTREPITGAAMVPGSAAITRPYDDDFTLLAVDGASPYVLERTANAAKATRFDPPPLPRTNSALAWDAAGDELFIYGGQDPAGVPTGELWTAHPDRTAAWERLDFPGDPPPATVGASLAWDDVADTLFVSAPASEHTGLWRVNLSQTPQWEMATPASSLAPARNAVLAVDHADGTGVATVWIAGGMTDAGQVGDLGRLDPTLAHPTWQRLSLAPSPQLVAGDGVFSGSPVGCFDAHAHQIQLFGESSPGGPVIVWSLSLGANPAWRLIATTDGPTSGFAVSAACSPSEGAAYVMFDRPDRGQRVQELWRIDINGDSHVWKPIDLSLGPGRLAGAALFGTFDALWQFGGSTPGSVAPDSFKSDLWRIPLR